VDSATQPPRASVPAVESRTYHGPYDNPGVLAAWPWAAFTLPHGEGYWVVGSADRTHLARTRDLEPLGLYRTVADAELAGYAAMAAYAREEAR
jgi:hypothetical protein